ncbi:MAG: hypothetical protein GF370_01960, partial [Candidatus Nealsonbacteria bacterium]|nr:hypothetical protein [Candidatus Nealsonbacteria bacterium]
MKNETDFSYGVFFFVTSFAVILGLINFAAEIYSLPYTITISPPGEGPIIKISPDTEEEIKSFSSEEEFKQYLQEAASNYSYQDFGLGLGGARGPSIGEEMFDVA